MCVCVCVCVCVRARSSRAVYFCVSRLGCSVIVLVCVSLRLFNDGMFVCVSHLGCSMTVCLRVCLTEAVQ